MRHRNRIVRCLMTAIFAVSVASAAWAEDGKPKPKDVRPEKLSHGPAAKEKGAKEKGPGMGHPGMPPHGPGGPVGPQGKGHPGMAPHGPGGPMGQKGNGPPPSPGMGHPGMPPQGPGGPGMRPPRRAFSDSDTDTDAVAARAERRAALKARHQQVVAARRKALENNSQHKKAVSSAELRRGPLAEEQRKHIRRMTSIQRVLALSIEMGDRDLTLRMRALYKKERDRHEKFMQTHKDRSK